MGNKSKGRLSKKCKRNKRSMNKKKQLKNGKTNLDINVCLSPASSPVPEAETYIPNTPKSSKYTAVEAPAPSPVSNVEPHIFDTPKSSKYITVEQPAPSTSTSDATNKESWIRFISEEEYASLNAHKLCIENIERPPDKIAIHGNKIVDVQYVINRTLSVQHEHDKICTVGKLEIADEINRGTGLISQILLKCKFCSKVYSLYTENPDKEKSIINTGAVWGTLAAGSTLGHLNQMLSSMNIATLKYSTYKKIETELGETWKDSLWIEMERAGREELQYAEDNNHFDKDGIPYITVYVDGGWSKRSYGHNYNAASGVGVIVGKITQKVLFVGVRNKYCCICARAANKQKPVGTHVCFKNWSGSSPAMEADIITEGFNCSEEMHGLRYSCFIADGDSSVYAKIRHNVKYGKNVTKLECTNHVIKNYGKSLYSLKKDTNINIRARKILTSTKIELLQKISQLAIFQNANGDVETLKEDLQNGPSHVFGNHKNCKGYYCKMSGTETADINAEILTEIFQYIKNALDRVIVKAHKLITNETNNAAECYMAIVARFNCGKRLNLTQRGSYSMRAYLAGLRYNKGPNWQLSPWKRIMKESPGVHFKKQLKNETRSATLRTVRRCLLPKNKKHKLKKKCVPNVDYGKYATQAELSAEEMASECNRKLNELQVTEEERIAISKKTIGQFDNPDYISYRENRLTASIFGQVIRRRDNTACDALVRQILRDTSINIESEAMKFGKRHEITAIKMFEQVMQQQSRQISVKQSGLFIDKKHCFLGASPDGITNTNEIVEVKCLYLLGKRGLDIYEAMNDKTLQNKICLEKNSNGNLQLKRKHNYYYQIQGQLNICEKEKCYFIIFTSTNSTLFVEEIYRDANLWNNEMLPKLCKFYMNCVLPEIVRGNRFKKLKCIDPEYILEARTHKLKGKEISQ